MNPHLITQKLLIALFILTATINCFASPLDDLARSAVIVNEMKMTQMQNDINDLQDAQEDLEHKQKMEFGESE